MAPKDRGYTMALTTVFQEQSNMIRVLIADDSIAIRDSLVSLLNAASGFQVVGLAGDALEVSEKARELVPDVVIMDTQMPQLDGVEATRRIKRELPGVGVLLFSVFTDYIEEGISAGADGYLMKDCEIEELFVALKRIATDSTAGG